MHTHYDYGFYPQATSILTPDYRTFTPIMAQSFTISPGGTSTEVRFKSGDESFVEKEG